MQFNKSVARKLIMVLLLAAQPFLLVKIIQESSNREASLLLTITSAHQVNNFQAADQAYRDGYQNAITNLGFKDKAIFDKEFILRKAELQENQLKFSLDNGLQKSMTYTEIFMLANLILFLIIVLDKLPTRNNKKPQPIAGVA